MGRTRRDLRSLSDAVPLWSKAPFVLFHYPGLFVSIAVGALLLALAASAYPLFISASASELVKAQIQEVSSTRWAVGMMYRQGTMPLSGSGVHGRTEARVDQLVDRLVAQSPYLAEPVESALAGLVPISAAGHEETRDTRLFFGEGVESNVEILEGSPGDGALVPDQIADALGISPGDRVVVGSPDGGAVTLPVDAVYRSLYKGGASDYWMAWKDDLVFYECPRNCPPPPPQALIVPRERFEAAARTVGLDHAAYAWQARLARNLTLEEAEDAARIATRISEQIDDSRLLDRCVIAIFCNTRDGATWGSSMDDVVDAVHDRLIAIEGPARLLRAAGILVALVVVAGAGAFAMATRRVESTLLFARGARPAAVAGRAALEALLPCAIGAGAGLALAFALVYGVGPNGALSHDASSEALAASWFTGFAAIVTIAAVSTVSFLRHSEHHRRRFAVLGALPWELILIALSLVILERLRRGGGAVADLSPDTEAPSLLLFAFPVAFLAGFVALVARGIGFLLGRARDRSARWGTPAYLAVHRLAAQPRLTMLLITTTGLCLGLFIQAQIVARSMATTVDAKAGAYVGSDVQVRINDYNETPSRFPLPLTRAVRRPFAAWSGSTCWPSTPTPSLPPHSGIPRSPQNRWTTSSDGSRGRPTEPCPSSWPRHRRRIRLPSRSTPGRCRSRWSGGPTRSPACSPGGRWSWSTRNDWSARSGARPTPSAGRAWATSSGSEAIPPSSGMRLPDSATGRTSSSPPTRSRTSRTSRRSSTRSS
jgi:hypothetical protein